MHLSGLLTPSPICFRGGGCQPHPSKGLCVQQDRMNRAVTTPSNQLHPSCWGQAESPSPLPLPLWGKEETLAAPRGGRFMLSFQGGWRKLLLLPLWKGRGLPATPSWGAEPQEIVQGGYRFIHPGKGGKAYPITLHKGSQSA